MLNVKIDEVDKNLTNKVETLRNRLEFVDKKFEKLYFELDMQIKQIYIEHGKMLRENAKKLEIVERDYGLMLEYHQKKIQSL